MFPFTDETEKFDETDPVLLGFQRLAETKEDPVEQNKIRDLIKFLEKRLEWKLIKTWPGLFKLYQHPDGSWKVEFDQPLEQRRRRLEEGVTPENPEVIQCLEALDFMLAPIHLCPPNGIPTKNDMPLPEQSSNILGTNILEIHEAALQLFHNTRLAVILTNKIQQTLSPKLGALLEGSTEERHQNAKSLKKTLARAIDIMAGVSSASLSHGNKPLFKDIESKLKLLSVIVIDTAKSLVQEGKKLPTKYELRERIKRDLPNVAFSERKWPEILKEAGLDKLPNKVPFKEKT